MHDRTKSQDRAPQMLNVVVVKITYCVPHFLQTQLVLKQMREEGIYTMLHRSTVTATI